ncbi:hypothetical protein [Mycobacterium lepromatosis]|uniref:hypothetical protein n=1 Tax=Mycobacterium lepromatosis TaxID=480418 RepID=UPI0006791AA0|nr:hypothetical protein [Mycobacterium lepromatosis]
MVFGAISGGGRYSANRVSQAISINSIDAHHTLPGLTGVDELNRVVGGNMVPGSARLLAGDPSASKSILLLKVAYHWTQSRRRALDISGEESAGQIRRSENRTGCDGTQMVNLAVESDLHTVLSHIVMV